MAVWCPGFPGLLSFAWDTKDASFLGNAIIDAVIVAAIAFAITWIVGLVVRLFNAPVTLDTQKTEAICKLRSQIATHDDEASSIAERQIAAQEAHTAELRRGREENDPLYRVLHAKQEEQYRKALGVGLKRADVRLSYKWDNEADPGAANFGFKIYAENRGPGDADVGDIFAEFCAEIGAPVFSHTYTRPMNTLFVPGQRQDILARILPSGDENLLCYGFVRWTDDAGSWEHLFCMQLRAHPQPNEHHFTQVGGAPWNAVRRQVAQQAQVS
jgi:hypothetical protein